MLYDDAALEDLRTRTAYEAWLLEAVYEIVDERLAFDDLDELIYPPTGAPPTQTIHGVGSVRIGDWRRGFLNAGAPLVFVTAFKLLDMLLEWVLGQNGQPSTYRFDRKIAALKGAVRFPSLIADRPWLCERLVALYENLKPLRGTIIHARHFKSVDGTLQVSSSKGGGYVGPTVTIAPGELRNVALVLVSLLRHLDGTWPLDLFCEKRLRRTLDEILHLHQLPSLDQPPPGFLCVRIYTLDSDPLVADMIRIRRDVVARRPGQDVIFDLRIVAVSPDGARASAYRVPWNELERCGPRLDRSHSQLASYAVPLPPGVDPVTVATEMKGRREQPA